MLKLKIQMLSKLSQNYVLSFFEVHQTNKDYMRKLYQHFHYRWEINKEVGLTAKINDMNHHTFHNKEVLHRAWIEFCIHTFKWPLPYIHGLMQIQKKLIHAIWAFMRLVPTKQRGKLWMGVVGLIGKNNEGI